MDDKNIKKAAALRYDREKDNAPKVVAKGKGASAEAIIKIAEAEGVPIRKDEELVELLSQVEIDKEIPPMLYKAVAEIFSFIYKATQNAPKKGTP
jgi:flagellar biosynthesis protein